MSEELEYRVLRAVADGQVTLPSIAAAVQQPQGPVDDRIRWAIGQRLLVPSQHGERWTFALSDSGRRLLAGRNREARTSRPGPPATLDGVLASLGSARRTTSRVVPRPSRTLSATDEAALAARQSWVLAVVFVGLVTTVLALLLVLLV